MANPFKPIRGPIDKLKRNVYDLSFDNNLSVNFGTLYPVFCKKVSPGDSMSIDTVFGLRAQPMIFPVQTKMRADVHFFYVRNRTLWSDWMDFYGKTGENLEHPYIERPISDFKTKSIYDYFGVTTTIMSNSWYSAHYCMNPFDPYNTAESSRNLSIELKMAAVKSAVRGDSALFSLYNESTFPYTDSFRVYEFSSRQNILGLDFTSDTTIGGTYSGTMTSFFPLYTREIYDTHNGDFVLSFPNAKGFGNFLGGKIRSFFYVCPERMSVISNGVKLNNLPIDQCWPYAPFSGVYSDLVLSHDSSMGYHFIVPRDLIDRVLNYVESSAYKSMLSEGKLYFCLLLSCSDGFSLSSGIPYSSSEHVGFGNICRFDAYTSVILDASEMNSLPWCGPDKTLKINAIPYRAYEAICNAFYRYVQVDPFKINGKEQYNRYVTNLSGGADSTPYKLYQRNYEYDFLTGAFHSPQQGLAPLVGLTVSNADQTAVFKFSSSSINNGAEITATTSISEDGQVIGITGYDPDLPQSNIDRLMTAINYGISINDIRQTNSLQKWLEKNIRRGYRYKDQIASHFGVSLDYDELLMPEFIGGVSQNINTDTIYQTATNENGYLGDIAGRAGVVGSSNHKVSKYCPEAGFIIGILSIVPTPVYSQVPAGYCFDNNLFDYFFPEFSKIGMQPIYNYQVTPLQAGDKLHEVFGYQRPYWDLIRSIDEVHGEFRTTANGYLVQRHFKDTPILNKHFLEINSDSLNDVFMITDTEVSDQFKGQIHFSVTKKTPIPLLGIPSIE